LLAPDGRDKAIAAASDIGDEAVAAPAVAQRLAQRGNMDPQRAFVDDGVGPSAGDQLILVNCVAGALNERDKDVQGAAAEAQRFHVLEQLALSGD
jgi:hypothetical protein